MVPAATTVTPQAYLQAQSRWHPLEIAFWLATLLPFILFPNYLSLASQIAITALFALSLDIILGYAGIVSLGHAAFFGIGAYTAGLLSKFGWGEPISGLIVAAAVAGLVGFAVSFVIARFRHFTLIMITLGLGLLAFETDQFEQADLRNREALAAARDHQRRNDRQRQRNLDAQRRAFADLPRGPSGRARGPHRAIRTARIAGWIRYPPGAVRLRAAHERHDRPVV